MAAAETGAPGLVSPTWTKRLFSLGCLHEFVCPSYTPCKLVDQVVEWRRFAAVAVSGKSKQSGGCTEYRVRRSLFILNQCAGKLVVRASLCLWTEVRKPCITRVAAHLIRGAEFPAWFVWTSSFFCQLLRSGERGLCILVREVLPVMHAGWSVLLPVRRVRGRI